MLAYLTTILIICACFYSIYKLPFFKISAFMPMQVLGLASLKVLAGICYIYINKTIINGGDIELFLHDAQIIHSYINQPKTVLKLLFGKCNVTPPPTELAQAINDMGFWWNSSPYFMVRFNAILLFFTKGNPYLQGALAGLFSFLGTLIWVKCFYAWNIKSKLGVIAIFIFPSIWFWTAGTHKETLILLSLGSFMLGFTHLLKGKHLLKGIILTLVGLSVTLVIRDFILYTFVPGLLILMVSKRTNLNPILLSVIIYGLFFILASTIEIPQYQLSIIELINHKRAQFAALSHGNTSFNLPRLTNSIGGIAQAIPNALYNVFLKYQTSTNGSTGIILTLTENIILIALSALVTLKVIVKRIHIKAIIVTLFTICLVNFIAIGLIVPNLGAIARYKSVFILPVLYILAFLSTKNSHKNI